ncbi:MAG: hypothetical protein KC635_16325 [Myxococcales bacterium]|nr:hypothetical protein [Myxococcales bacterium]MCB9736635.1 hypothetical protein [Deltaproteobacteria bacterium]
MTRRLLVVAVLALSATGGCADATSTGGEVLPALRLARARPLTLAPGTRVTLTGVGFVPEPVARYEATLAGVAGGEPLTLPMAVARVDDETLVATLDDGGLAAIATRGEALAGALTVRRIAGDGGGSALVDEASLPVTVTASATLSPRFDAFGGAASGAGLDLYPGDRVAIAGDGLLQLDEGATLLRFDGRFVPESGGDARVVDGLVVPVALVDPGDRTRAELTLTPDVLGVRPGRFEGVLQLVNAHASGAEVGSALLDPGPLALRRPVVTAIAPTTAARGQRITVTGRGLMPPDSLLQAATVLLLDGVFTPNRGAPVVYEGRDALALYPDGGVDNRALAIVLRLALDADGVPTGLAARTGTFAGRVRPLLFAGPDSVEGTGLPVALTLTTPRQVVVLRLLPDFYDALATFGLANAADEVVARILAVCARDYAGVDVAFSLAPPDDFAEYAIVELAGRDPNGAGLFGLDNTAGKDVGNVRLDDVIGGFNAETREQSFAAYGGIFVAELRELSATLGTHELRSARFDDVFGPVMPELGGAPASVGEAALETPRGAAVREAVRVLGNLVGNTVTHEVGHTLGLTAQSGKVHNEGDNPGWIMDAGRYRPFAERAEIDGQGPAVFAPFNRAYLEEILPLSATEPSAAGGAR